MRKRQRFISVLCAAVLMLNFVPSVSAQGNQPAESSNIHRGDYTVWSKPVQSHLYQNSQGGLTRVEYIGDEVVVEDYNSSFQLTASRRIPAELPIWGGFFSGETCNFLIFGQENPSESDQAEVIRVVKYSKDWKRLDSGSLYGANTTIPFDAGSLRCDEYGGYLYIRTSHEMYKSRDGYNHQANLTMSVRQSDMEVVDSFYRVMNSDYGYVSHSFNQFLIVDEDGHIVTLDHGDAHPRSVVFMRYYGDAGTGKFTETSHNGRLCSVGDMLTFAGDIGDNQTGGSVGGLAETRDCYIMTYNYDGVGGSGDRSPYYHWMDKASGKSWSAKVFDTPGCTTPMLASTGLDGGYMLWNEKSGYTEGDTLYYLEYAADGQPGAPPCPTATPSPMETVWYGMSPISRPPPSIRWMMPA